MVDNTSHHKRKYRMWERPREMEYCDTIDNEKKSGDNRIFRLRRINHYEVDYSLVLKYHWSQQAAYREENEGTLGINQVGGKKNEEQMM